MHSLPVTRRRLRQDFRFSQMSLIPETTNAGAAPLSDAIRHHEARHRSKNKPGRPPNVNDAQRTFIMNGFPAYLSLRQAGRPQPEIAACITRHVNRYLDFFTSEGAFRRGARVLDETDGEDEEWIDMDVDGDTPALVGNAKAVVRRSDDTDADRHLKQDKLFKAVRKVCLQVLPA